MFTEVAGQHQVMRHVFLILTNYICLARATALMWSRNIHISQKTWVCFPVPRFFSSALLVLSPAHFVFLTNWQAAQPSAFHLLSLSISKPL